MIGLYYPKVGQPGLNGEVVIHVAKHRIKTAKRVPDDPYFPGVQILGVTIGEHREPRGRKSIDLIPDAWLSPYRILSTGVSGYKTSVSERSWLFHGRSIEIPPDGVDFIPPWTKGLARRVNAISERWHLNETQGACRHQQRLGWRYCQGNHETKQETCLGELGPNDLARMQEKLGLPVGRGPKQKFRSTIGNDRWECGLNGLSQPCPVCGYKMGHEWLFEVLPESVYEFLVRELPARVW